MPTCTSRTAGSPSRSPTWKTGCPSCSASTPSTAAAWAPRPARAAVHAELEAQRQTVLDLRRALDERDEELAAARETNRRLMNQLNRSGG